MSNEQFYFPIKCDRCEEPIENVSELVQLDIMGELKYHKHCADVVTAIVAMNDYSGGEV